MNPVRFALLGTGGRGQIYVDVLSRMPDRRAVWTAMCDRNPEALASFCDRNSLTDVARVTSVDDLVGRDDIDAVPDLHPRLRASRAGREVLQRRYHCLVEKPVATNPDDVRAICEAARHSGKLMHLGFVFRYDPLRDQAARDGRRRGHRQGHLLPHP